MLNDVGNPAAPDVERIARPTPLALRGSTLFEGDALTVLRRLPSSSVRCVVTSPPYWGLRDYGIDDQIGLDATLPQFLHRLVAIFEETKRVLAADGTLWLNIGDGYTSGNRGWRAPDKKNPARAMNIRPDTPQGLKPKDLIGVPWRLAFALQDNGWYLRSDIVWHKPNAMPESVKDRPTRSHEYLFMLTKSEQYFYDWQAVREPAGGGKLRNRRSVWNVNTKPLGLECEHQTLCRRPLRHLPARVDPALHPGLHRTGRLRARPLLRLGNRGPGLPGGKPAVRGHRTQPGIRVPGGESPARPGQQRNQDSRRMTIRFPPPKLQIGFAFNLETSVGRARVRFSRVA
jgi:site-specific DNA-methyltransferase (adenine-specific)